jgi:hypothetical protein
MSAEEPRGIMVAFSTAQLDDAGITDDVDDEDLADIVDDFLRTFSDQLRESVAIWIDDHQDNR